MRALIRRIYLPNYNYRNTPPSSQPSHTQQLLAPPNHTNAANAAVETHIPSFTAASTVTNLVFAATNLALVAGSENRGSNQTFRFRIVRLKGS